MAQIINLQDQKTEKSHKNAIKQAPVTLVSRFETERVTFKNLSDQVKMREKFAAEIGRYMFQQGFIAEDNYAVPGHPEMIGVEMRITFFPHDR